MKQMHLIDSDIHFKQIANDKSSNSHLVFKRWKRKWESIESTNSL